MSDHAAMNNLSQVFPDNNAGVKETKSSGPNPKKMAMTDSANDIEYGTFLDTITDKTHLTALSGKSKYLIEQRPRHSKTDYDTYVIINLTVNRIRNVDSKTSSVDARFIISCQWKLDFDYFNRPMGKDNKVGAEFYKTKVIDKQRMWFPPIEIQNRDDLIIEKDPTLLYLDKGYARCLYHCNGTISNVMDLKLFPFDFNLIRLRVIGSIGTNKEVKLFWRKNRKLKHVLTDSTIEQLTEWYVIADRIFAERMNTAWSTREKEYLQKRKLCFEMNAIEITIPIQREYGFYMKKIMLILSILCITGWTIIYIDEFVERLNIASALLLAAIAFLYIVNEAIPKLSYLTAIDTMILSCFFNLFLGIAVSFGVYWLNRKSREGYEDIAFIVNEIGFYLLPASFVTLTYGTMALSIFKRNGQMNAHWAKLGLSKKDSVDKVLDERGVMRTTLDTSDCTNIETNVGGSQALNPQELKTKKKKEREFKAMSRKNVDQKLVDSLTEFNALLKDFLSDLKDRRQQ